MGELSKRFTTKGTYIISQGRKYITLKNNDTNGYIFDLNDFGNDTLETDGNNVKMINVTPIRAGKRFDVLAGTYTITCSSGEAEAKALCKELKDCIRHLPGHSESVFKTKPDFLGNRGIGSTITASKVAKPNPEDATGLSSDSLAASSAGGAGIDKPSEIRRRRLTGQSLIDRLATATLCASRRSCVATTTLYHKCEC